MGLWDGDGILARFLRGVAMVWCSSFFVSRGEILVSCLSIAIDGGYLPSIVDFIIIFFE